MSKRNSQFTILVPFLGEGTSEAFSLNVGLRVIVMACV